MPKVLVVLTSQDKIPATDHPTGWYLVSCNSSLFPRPCSFVANPVSPSQPEFAHPWDVLHGKADLVIASPKGGEAPLDPGSVKMFENDPVSTKFLNEQEALWKKTEKLADFRDRVDEFDAIFYVGGHGRKLLLLPPESTSPTGMNGQPNR